MLTCKNDIFIESFFFPPLNCYPIKRHEIVDHIILDNYNKYFADIFALRSYIFSLEDSCPAKKSFLYLYHLILTKYSSYIGPQSKFSSTPIFPHQYFGIFISNRSIIGNNCTIFQNVTIGSNTLSKIQGAPIIGDNVYIGAGACLFGKIRVGNNCRIGGGTIVTSDIPDNTSCVSQKPRLLLHSEKLINNFHL